MPFKIAAHPEHAPKVLRPNKGRFRDRMLHFLLRILPFWPNLKDLNAVAGDSIAEIELGPDVRRRTTMLHELRQIALDSLLLDDVECHCLVTPCILKSSEL